MRRLRAFLPRAAVLCALVGVLHAAAWALITPPLQVPDEQAHLYFAQYLAETGSVPRPGPRAAQSREERIFEVGVRRAATTGNFYGRPLWTQTESRALAERLRGAERRGGGGDLGVGSYTPLYYVSLVPAWWAVELGGGDISDRLLAMRLVSALYAGLTVLFVFLFLRELVPRRPEAWVYGALAVALLPSFAFTVGGVNPDAGLAAAAAALFFFVARGFRTRLTPGVAVGIGASAAAAVLMKLAGAGLVPGAALAVVLLAVRDRRAGYTDAARGALLAAGVAAAPMLVYLLVNATAWGRPLLPASGGVGVPGADTSSGSARSLRGLLTYSWQYALPRLGSMFDWFPGWAPYDVWWRGWVGRFGWGDSGFSDQTVARAGWTLLVVLAGLVVALARRGAALRHRAPEALAYATLAAGLVALLAWVGYGYRADTGGLMFEQARYLFPLMALFGAVVGLGITGFGRRLATTVGLSVVVLESGLMVGALMLVLERYYA